MFPLPSFAHSTNIVLNEATEAVELDGKVQDNEWSDASQISFKAVNNLTAYVYMKYDHEKKFLYGAFTIPDNTPSDEDALWWSFDPNHSGGIVGDKRTGDFILLLWNDFFEYSDTQDVSNYAFDNYRVSDFSPELVIDPPKPFRVFDYNVTVSAIEWQGEFRAKITDLDTAIIGFIIDQRDAPEDGAEAKDALFPQDYEFGSGAGYYADLVFPQDVVSSDLESQSSKEAFSDQYAIITAVAAAGIVSVFALIRFGKLRKKSRVV